ncbi:MAG TPA: class I SAM-dependent methyltransferase [Candidatus Bilophila faecipullorum]|uniref:Class I SAM-dependent methyltransferase n=1 Tax=Candidatus Bilophila faecipullorum TaxID=2838482 RepID=A0A9D1U8N7_9BACT|nr:methyltransferase domain-containing protein [uncultured Bilophila sp.]HIW77626.1 class I SAM-dependent methyltransferase [Candidatus Bilophila faecipullorum]
MAFLETFRRFLRSDNLALVERAALDGLHQELERLRHEVGSAEALGEIQRQLSGLSDRTDTLLSRVAALESADENTLRAFLEGQKRGEEDQLAFRGLEKGLSGLQSSLEGLAAASEARKNDFEAKAGERHRATLEYLMFLRWQLMDRLEEISPFPLPDRCPLCGGALSGQLRRYETECIFHGGRLLRHQCPHCDVIFGPQKMLRLSEADLAEEYRWHYTFSNESNTLEKELRAFEQLRPRKDGVYLNYGAGRWSHTGEHLRAQGWNVYDYEPYSQPEGEFVITDRHRLSGMAFDGLFSQDVVEHLRHPAEEMRFMSSLVKEGGRMVHVTGCWEYMYEYTRFHLFFFLGRSKEVLARESGLRLMEYVRDDANPALPYYSCTFQKLEGK